MLATALQLVLTSPLLAARGDVSGGTPQGTKKLPAASPLAPGARRTQPPERDVKPEKDQESASERRAVRGSAADESLESPELSELRQFEEQTFLHTGGTASRVTDTDAPEEPEEPPPELPGRWEGTGDVPEVLRSGQANVSERAVNGSERAVSAASRTPVLPDSEWLRSLKLPELPVRWDPVVLHYLEYFRSHPRGHAIMGNWLRRAGRYRALIEGTLDKEGLPRDLIYLAMVESGFETAARSRAGAGGIWQFMPGAARAYGLEVSYWLDARRDPERSAEAAARYLKDLYVRFGSWHLVFAAYNAGYGAVLQSITRYNTNDYWELCRHEAGLPWESSLYVPKILAAAIVGHNPEAFGFGDLVPDPPLAFERVDVPGGTNLAVVARAIASSTETLAALNPQIARERVPPDRPMFGLRVPIGSRSLFADNFERLRGASGGERLDTVTLRFGETLDAVARARGTSTRELRRLNGVKDSSELRAGVAILVPRRRDAIREGATARPDPPGGPAAGAGRGEGGEAGTGGEDDQILVAVPDRVFNYEGRERVFYRTRDADTLEEVAEVFGVRVDDLVEWNNIDATAKLHPKMVLQIFVRKDFDPRNVVLLDTAGVRVVTLGSREFLELEAARRGKKRLVVEARAGDTLAKLGRRYGLTVGDLARINRFSSSSELQGGQQIVVYSPSGGVPGHEIVRGMAAVAVARREREREREGSRSRLATTVLSRPTTNTTTTTTKPLASTIAHPASASGAHTNRPRSSGYVEGQMSGKAAGRTSARVSSNPSGGSASSTNRPGDKSKPTARKVDAPKGETSRGQIKERVAPLAAGAAAPGKGASHKPK